MLPEPKFLAQLLHGLLPDQAFMLIYSSAQGDRMVSNIHDEQLINTLRRAADELEAGAVKSTVLHHGEQPAH